MTLISSLSDYLGWIAGLNLGSADCRLLFRGHSSKAYVAEPSIFRAKAWAEHENEMIKRLLASHPDSFEKDLTTLEKLVRAQHYGLPTRLLDVTRNPLVALYFACRPNKKNKREATGEVIIFSPKTARQKYFDSDTVSCLANLGLLTIKQRERIRLHLLRSRDKAFEAFPEDEINFRNMWIAKFNEDVDVQRLSHLVSIERPGFVPRIDPTDLANVFAVVPRKLNTRMAAQFGEFLVFGLKFDPNEHYFVDNIEIQEVYISGSRKVDILKELRTLTISHENLFPEIDKTAEQIKLEFSVTPDDKRTK